MKEIVVLGAGYAGLKTVHDLQKLINPEEAHITLVDKNAYHYEATELHEVASGTEPREKITYPIAEVVRPKYTTFIQDAVVKVVPEENKVVLEKHGDLKYDECVIALGFVSETFGVPGAKEHALEMVDIDTSLGIDDHIVAMMNKYRETQDPEYLKIIVCGAGFTGIELAGALVEGSKRYAKIAGVKPKDIQIIVVEAATRLLPMFSEKLADYGVNLIKKLGVKLLTGCMVKEIKPNEVCYQEGEDFKTVTGKTIIWTTGVSGSPIMAESNFKARRGRVIVDDELLDQDYRNVYIIGDVAALMDKATNRPYPTTAQIATQMGAYVAKSIAARLHGQKIGPFVYKCRGTVASAGNTHGFGVVGKGNEVKGYPASVIKKMIMNKSLKDIGDWKQVMAKGRFDLYH